MLPTKKLALSSDLTYGETPKSFRFNPDFYHLRIYELHQALESVNASSITDNFATEDTDMMALDENDDEFSIEDQPYEVANMDIRVFRDGSAQFVWYIKNSKKTIWSDLFYLHAIL